MTEAAFETASWLRRILALMVDWVASILAVVPFVGTGVIPFGGGDPGGTDQFYVLLMYVGESAVLTWFAGGSFGKLATGLRVVPVDGHVRMLNPLKVVARQVSVVLVIPPLVFRQDGRGLHDMLAGTATVTTPTFRELMPGTG